MPLDRDVLTTGEVAKICNVAPRTVSKWFDSGQLKGYRIPGSKDRRIPVSELVRFMQDHGIPMDGITSGRTRVLIVDDDAELTGTLEDVLASQTDYEVRTATASFKAGLECERFKPHVVLVDIHIGGGDDGRQIAEMLRSGPGGASIRVIAMSNRLTEGQASGLRGIGFDGFLAKPFAIRKAIELIECATPMAA